MHRTFRAAPLALALTAGAAPASLAQDMDGAARDLSVEQTAVLAVQPPAPAISPSGERLSVVAWVDHADNTYAVGETVRLFVKANKDAWITVLNVGPSGRATVLFPNAHQPETRVAAGRVVEVPAAGSGASIRATGPAGRELIKVIASTSPTPVFAAADGGGGPFTVLAAGGRALARDLQVAMDTQAEQEWDDYNKVVTTVATRPMALAPLAPGVPGEAAAWPADPLGLRVATDKHVYRMGEPVSIYVRAASPCYLTLVNIGPSGQTRVLLPNAAQPVNLIPAGGTVVFPAAASNLQVTPIGPAGMETVVALCGADNRPVFPAGLSYGRNGFAEVGGAAAARDLTVAAAAPNRAVGQATVGFAVTP